MKALGFGARTTATGGAAGEAAAAIWNTSGRTVSVKEIWIMNTSGDAVHGGIKFTTTRGTPGTTVNIENNIVFNKDRELNSLANVTLDMNFGGSDPTYASTAYISRFQVSALQGAGIILQFPDPLQLPTSGGIAIIAATAAAFPACDVTFILEA